ncbi:MAG: GNAT family N-acetyltransferase [Alphaproteobacteria bacterium]|nr:GNAT family N-acetyltransferase [Alphaproteobacteria bacterium]
MIDLIPLGEAGVDAAAAVHGAAVQDGERWSRAAIATLLAMPGAFGFLAPGKYGSAGFILARVVADEAEIFYLAVRPEARRNGIGRRLFAAALGEAGRRGCRRLYLEVAEDNLPAHALYSGAGLAAVGRRAGYYRRSAGPAVDALVMARDI